MPAADLDAPRTLVFVAPWEASAAVARIPRRPNARVVLALIESVEMGARLPWHRQKLTLVLSAMRHFAAELRASGHVVDLRRADDYAAGLADAARAHGAARVVATRARDWYVASEWARLRDTLGARDVALELREDRGFLSTPEQFASFARRYGPGVRPGAFRLEDFYQAMRRRHRVLLDAAGGPEGGRWNYDIENRRAWPVRRPLPPVWGVTPDAVTRRVMARVARWPHAWGPADGFALPVTRADALAWLDRFADERLPTFGPYEDAMRHSAPDLLHSTLAPLLNVGLLEPLEVVRRAERAYRDGLAPLASVEGFVRQILGWREYVRGMYWRLGPRFEHANALGADRALPRVFWAPDGEAYGNASVPAVGPAAAEAPASAEESAAPADPTRRMRCLTDTVRHVRDRARVHHIPRLMVQANVATLLGVRPAEINRWFWAAFTDAAHWVTTPNVVGMATWGDGGRVASKPYVASGAYVRRMSDFCRGCAFDVTRRTGPTACPVNALYWDFLARHRDRFAAHPRMAHAVAHLDRIPPEELLEVRATAAALRDAVVYDAPTAPVPIPAEVLTTTLAAPARTARPASGAVTR